MPVHSTLSLKSRGGSHDKNYLQLHCVITLLLIMNSLIINSHDVLSTFNLFVFQKENEKAVDELRKFYSAQAVKHKENMQQAVNHKVCGL